MSQDTRLGKLAVHMSAGILEERDAAMPVSLKMCLQSFS